MVSNHGCNPLTGLGWSPFFLHFFGKGSVKHLGFVSGPVGWCPFFFGGGGKGSFFPFKVEQPKKEKEKRGSLDHGVFKWGTTSKEVG